MKQLRIIVSSILIITLMLGIFVLCASAKSTFDGLEISLETDTDSYERGEEIVATLKVKNASDSTVNNLTLEHVLSDSCTLSEDSEEPVKKIASLKEDGEESLKIYFVAKTTSALLLIILFSVAGLVVAGGVALLIIVIVKKKRAKETVAVILCIIMIGGLIAPLTASAAEKAEKQEKPQCIVNVTKKVSVGGVQVKLLATVTYDETNGQKKNISVTTDGMIYDEETDVYHCLEKLEKLTGTVANTKGVKSALCKITDANGNVLLEKSFKAKASFSIDGVALIVGMNKIEITLEYKDGTKSVNSMNVNNVCEDNMKDLDVDRGDDDDDGVLNFIETLKDTDPKKEDTDGDGLSDYYELAHIGTDPTKKDSDGNGTEDSDEDADGDGLSNSDEIDKHKTNPITTDSDFDGLTDKNELENHKTDPQKKDTDGDGKDDKWELDNGYDPLTKNDNFPEDKPVTPDNITVESEGEVTINVIPDDFFINEDTPGYIGEDPIEVDMDEGSSATITIDYDKSALPDGDKPTLYYFNQETQCYESVDTTVDENGSATATVTKPGVYVLLNHRYVDDVWNNDIFRPSADTDDGAIDVVFVVDRSGSMSSNDPNGIRKEVTKEFIKKLRADKDRAAIVQFSNAAETISALSSDQEAHINAVDGITTSSSSCDDSSGTNGSAGLREALNQLEGSTAPHKYIIFLTDGEDTEVAEDYGDELGTMGITGEARSKGIIIHTVGLIGSGSVDVDLLKRVAAGTGGNYYVATVGEEAENESELVQVYEEIESVTIDRKKDSNNDGISDYYTKVICEGKLTTATGISCLFGTYTYDDVQAGDDLDGDGIKNGDELQIVENEKGVYVKVVSYPYAKDSDNDTLPDSDDKKAGVSPLKKNALANIPDVDWIIDDNKFSSNDYLEYYNESNWEKGCVFVGNAFFGTTLNQTTLYKYALVDYFQAIDAELVTAAEIQNYQELAAAYLEAATDEMKDAIIKEIKNKDKEKAKTLIDDFYGFIKGLNDVFSTSENISTLTNSENFFLTLYKYADKLDVETCEKLIEAYNKQISYTIKTTKYAGGATKGTWTKVLEMLDEKVFEYTKRMNIGKSNIKFKMNRFDKFSKAMKIADNVLFVIDLGVTVWDSHLDYCNLLASMDTIEANAYVLECISASSKNFYLSAAATDLGIYLSDVFSEETKKVYTELMTSLECTTELAVKTGHKLLAASGPPGLIVEMVRDVSNLVFGLDKKAEACSKTVALALTADILAENYKDHLEGGYAVSYSKKWVGYADYSDTMYVHFLNLCELRKRAELVRKEMKPGKEAKKLCDSNIEKCDELIDKYTERYFEYYLS